MKSQGLLNINEKTTWVSLLGPTAARGHVSGCLLDSLKNCCSSWHQDHRFFLSIQFDEGHIYPSSRHLFDHLTLDPPFKSPTSYPFQDKYIKYIDV